MTYLLTQAAADDLDRTAKYTVGAFGAAQANSYRHLVSAALNNIASEPLRLSSRSHDKISPGLGSYRIALAGSRISAASHVLCYRVESNPAATVTVLRILHERMDPEQHLS